MTTYTVWVGGENSWNRSYGAEVGFLPLTQAQIDQWIPEDIDDIETEVISERVCNWDYSEDPLDFPSRDEIENGCMGYGAYTDQTFGVARETDDGEEEIIWKGAVQELNNVDDLDEELVAPAVKWTCEDPSMEFSEDEYKPVPGVGYLNTHKGGWGASFDLPDDEEFDVRKLCFDVLEVEGLCEIVTGFSYNEVDYYDDSDTDGKGCDIFLNVEGGYEVRLL
jgi:hypothetical protein